MFIDKHSISDIFLVLEKLISGRTDYEKTEKSLKQLSKAYELNYDDLINLYNKMSLFRMDLQRVGGEEAYLKSDILWLQSELELLLECYRIFQESGASVALISNSLSKGHLNVFPKTKSQLQNTYYKLRNGQIALETTWKQKPGRKPIQEVRIPFGLEKEEVSKELEEAPKRLEEVQSQQENGTANHKKNLVQLLSGMINNFQVVCDHNTKSEKKLYQLIEGIYELSAMSAERTIIHQDVEALKTELNMLRVENERLKQEKDELLEDIRNMTDGINSFIKSSDVDQLRGLSHFINTCKRELNKLGLYNDTSERNLKIVVDGSGQVLSISE